MESLKKFPQVDMDILIDVDQKEKLKLNELLIFPHGMDGLHIWEAGIVLARYLYKNLSLFEGRSVHELGTGVGIAGLTLLKYSKCKEICLSDYKEEILANAKLNIKKNGFEKDKRVRTLKLDWKDYATVKETVDFIVGSDIIYIGSPVKELALLLQKMLVVGGMAIINIPDRKSYATEFLEQIDLLGCFEITTEELTDSFYVANPLEDKKEGAKHFVGLQELGFIIYKFKKIK